MKIILNEDVYNLGEEGDICQVAPGYARNYLVPKNLAVPFNKTNLAVFESRKDAIQKRKSEKRDAAKSLREKLDGKVLEIKLPAGETGKLFGSLTNALVAEELEKEGISVDRKKIDVVSHQIKMIGSYSVKVRLYEGETAEMTVKIASLDGKAEAALEARKGEPVAKPAAEETEAEAEVDEEAAADEFFAENEESDDDGESGEPVEE